MAAEKINLKLNRSSIGIILFLFLVVGQIGLSFQEGLCVNKDPCSCTLKDGKVINLRPLGFRNGKPKFPDIELFPKPKEGDDPGYSIAYNPCHSFNDTWDKDDKTNCQNVAGCMHLNGTMSGTLLPAISQVAYGAQDTAAFTTEGEKDQKRYFVSYSTKINETLSKELKIELKCLKGTKIDDTTIQTGDKFDPNIATSVSLILSSVCACEDGCKEPEPVKPSSGLSTGSVLLIIFFVVLILYILGGALYNKVVLGAQGVEIFPHIEFWTSVPGLAFDGLRFVCTCCRSRNKAGQYNDI